MTSISGSPWSVSASDRQLENVQWAGGAREITHAKANCENDPDKQFTSRDPQVEEP